MATLPPRSGAFSKGYNFAYAWDKKAPLTGQQKAAVSALSQTLADGPFPANLQDADNNSAFEEAGAVDAVLVNTHQFYKWFAQLESAMKSETDEKYRLYESTLQEHVNTCDGILRQVDDTLTLFEEVQSLHSRAAIRIQTSRDACDQLLMDKQRLIGFAEALRSHPSEIQRGTPNFLVLRV